MLDLRERMESSGGQRTIRADMAGRDAVSCPGTCTRSDAGLFVYKSMALSPSDLDMLQGLPCFFRRQELCDLCKLLTRSDKHPKRYYLSRST